MNNLLSEATIIDVLKNIDSKQIIQNLLTYIRQDEHAKQVFGDLIKTAVKAYVIKKSTKDPKKRKELLEQLRKEKHPHKVSSDVKKGVAITSILLIIGYATYANLSNYKNMISKFKDLLSMNRVTNILNNIFNMILKKINESDLGISEPLKNFFSTKKINNNH